MKFNPIIKNVKREKLIQYFIKHKIFNNKNFVKKIEKINNPFSDDHISKKNIDQFGPELFDLYRLHQIILKYKRTTVLEFGIGWSTKIFANALLINKKKFSKKVKSLRFNNPFEVHAVDNFKKYINETQKKLSTNEKKITFIKFSDVKMCQYNGIISTEYNQLPRINPDLIYLDGPSLFNVKGSINNISTSHKDYMPISCDILKIEYFLRPGTIIVIDGRTTNYRFLKNNLQRKWKSFDDFENDQYFLILDEPPLGKLNAEQKKFYFN